MWELFFFKNHAENKAGRLVQDLFLFFEKASKQVVSILVLIYIGRPPLDNCMSFQTVDLEIRSVWFFIKGSETSFPILYMISKEKYVLFYILLTDQILWSGYIYFCRC